MNLLVIKPGHVAVKLTIPKIIFLSLDFCDLHCICIRPTLCPTSKIRCHVTSYYRRETINTCVVYGIVASAHCMVNRSEVYSLPKVTSNL